ncbi:MAG: hypothetical protein AB1715_09000, partial [Acidobacteriota bacterium]
MKKPCLVFLLAVFFSGTHAAPPATLKFHAPNFNEPFYRIHVPLEVKGEKIQVRELLLKGVRAGSFLIFKQGKPVAADTPLEEGVYDIVLDYAWTGGKDYELSVHCLPDKKKETQKLWFKGLSPQAGGIPGGREGFYRILQVENDSDFERNQEMVTATLTAPKADTEGAGFVLYDAGRQIPFEVLEIRESIPPAAVSSSSPVTLTYKLGLALDAKAREKKMLVLLKGASGARPEKQIAVSGEGLGKTVRNAKLALEFHPQSGQINTIEAFEPGVKLYNKAGVIHWNPDVFVAGVAWDHSFDWNPPAVFEEKIGSSFYLNSR